MSTFDQHATTPCFGLDNGLKRSTDRSMNSKGPRNIGMRHSRVRHHEAGIQEARALFGEVAAEAARQHIITDLKEEGWTETNPFSG